jgi:hypothetical protein
MNLERSNNVLVKKHGLTGAISIEVIRIIELERLSEVDLFIIKGLWKKVHKKLSIKKSHTHFDCAFQAFAGLFFFRHIKLREGISIKKSYPFGRSYKYVLTAICILKADYDNIWPQSLKATDLWNQVFDKLNKRRIAYNSQLHVLKALIENDLIELIKNN